MAFSFKLGINDHDLLWSQPVSYPLTQLSTLGVSVHRCDLEVAAAGYTGTLGSTQSNNEVSAWSVALKKINVQPLVVITFPSLPDTATVVTGIESLVKAVPGLWIEWGNELDGVGTYSASTYVAQFSSLVSTVHAADSTAKIGPAPVSNINNGGGGWNWYKDLFAAGLASVDYDFLPFHNYPYPTDLSPTTAWSGTESALTLIPAFTAQVTAWGNTKPYWLTECGWQSSDGNMTEALQSQYVVEFLNAVGAYDLPVVIGYELGDGGGQTYGWMTAGWAAPKPVYTAVQALTGGVVPSPPPSTELPDLTIESVVVNPGTSGSLPTVVGDVISFSAVVKNIGTAATPAGVIIGVAFNVDGTEVSWSDTDTTSLGVGDSISLTSDTTKTWTATAGTHTLLANVNDQVNGVYRIVESDYTNNTLSLTFDVLVPVPVTTVPGIPTDVVAVAGIDDVTLSWVAPSDDGGSAITGYNIYSISDAGSTILEEVTSTSTSTTISNLIPGTEYTFSVSAINSVGASPATGSNTVTPTAPIVPTPPKELTLSFKIESITCNAVGDAHYTSSIADDTVVAVAPQGGPNGFTTAIVGRYIVDGNTAISVSGGPKEGTLNVVFSILS